MHWKGNFLGLGQKYDSKGYHICQEKTAVKNRRISSPGGLKFAAGYLGKIFKACKIKPVRT